MTQKFNFAVTEKQQTVTDTNLHLQTTQTGNLRSAEKEPFSYHFYPEKDRAGVISSWTIALYGTEVCDS